MKSACTCIILLLPLLALCQSGVQIEHLSARQGLSHRWVNDVFQDSKGFLWFSTIDGLNRYDGNEFSVFRPSHFNEKTENDWIWWAREDRTGKFRVGAKGTVQLFDPATERFVPFPFDSWVRNIPTSNFIGLDLNDPKEPYWRPLDGYYVASQEEMAFYKFTGENKPQVLKTLKFSYHDYLLFSTENKAWFWVPQTGYWLVDLENGTQQCFGLNGNQSWQGQAAFPIDKATHTLWLPAADGSETFLEVPLPAKYPPALCDGFLLDNKSNAWFSMNDGKIHLFRYGTDDLCLEEIAILPFSFCSAVYEDREGTIWIAHQLGVEKITRKKKLFDNYLNVPLEQADATVGFTCRNMVEDPSGDIFLEDDNHLFVIEAGSTVGKPASLHLSGMPLIVPKSLFADREGAIWIPASDGSLIKMTSLTGECQIFRAPNIDRVFNHVVEDAEERLWLAMQSELNGSWTAVFEKKTGRFFLPECREVNIDYALLQPGKNILWAFHPKGLVKINCRSEQAETVNLYETPRDQRQILFHEGFAWLATSKGLVKLDTATWQHVTFNRAQGLPADFVYSIMADGEYLWLGTSDGLCRFNFRTLSVKNYFVEDGLSHNEFNSKAVLKTRDGRFFMGGLNGVNVFRPEDLAKQSAYRPNLLWMNFSKYDGRKDSATVLQTIDFEPSKTLFLHHSDKSFTFHFALTSYFDPKNNQYAFYLEGLEKDWQPMRNVPFATYYYMPPGEYVLHVKATDPSGNPAANELAIRVVMLRAWWLRWWALALYALALGGGSFFAYRYQLRRKLEHAENLRLKELDTVKTQLYTNITHEFRTPLTIILGLTRQWLLREKQGGDWREQFQMVHNNGQRLLHLVNQILDLHKLEAGSMKPNLVLGDVAPLCRYLFNSFHSWALGKGVDFRLLIEPDSIVADHDHDKLSKIISNLISNAIKFTPGGGQVQLAVAVISKQLAVGRGVLATTANCQLPLPTANCLLITVTDTGAGIPEDKIPHIFDRFYQVDSSSTRSGEGTGIGLTLTKELVGLMKGRIEVHSIPGAGSSFKIILPLTQNAALAPAEAIWDKEVELAAPPQNGDLVKNQNIGQGKPVVLIVEDNSEVARYTALCLGKGFQIHFAANGEEGIHKALELMPDLVISDVMMPVKDGFELTRTLKNDPVTSHIPIILLTARAEIEDRLEGLRRGADAYLSKPFNEEELQIRAAQLLALRSKLQKRYANLDNPPETEPAPDSDQDAADADFDFQLEDAFFQKVLSVIEAHLSDASFSNGDLCRKLHMSSAQLHRKVSALTGHAPAQLFRLVRLRKAKELLKTTGKPVSEIAFETGFNDPSYFTRAFVKANGVSPSEFREQAALRP